MNDEENQEDEFFEYEPASEEEEEKQDHDYNYEKEEFLNPVIIKMPDGTLNIGTESKDKQIVIQFFESILLERSSLLELQEQTLI